MMSKCGQIEQNKLGYMLMVAIFIHVETLLQANKKRFKSHIKCFGAQTLSTHSPNFQCKRLATSYFRRKQEVKWKPRQRKSTTTHITLSSKFNKPFILPLCVLWVYRVLYRCTTTGRTIDITSNYVDIFVLGCEISKQVKNALTFGGSFRSLIHGHYCHIHLRNSHFPIFGHWRSVRMMRSVATKRSWFSSFICLQPNPSVQDCESEAPG